MSSIDADLALRELYETTYHLYDHNLPTEHRPLALVGRNAAEDPATFSPLHRRIDEYVELQVFEHTGMPFDQFIQLPAEYVRRLLAAAKRAIARKSAGTGNAIKQLDADLAAMRGMNR